jgi:hypothetical protein
LLFGLHALFTQCFEAIEPGFRNRQGTLGSGKSPFRFKHPRSLLGIIEKNHDLTLLHRVSFLYADPPDDSNETWAELYPLAIDNVSARGEQRVVRPRRRRSGN